MTGAPDLTDPVSPSYGLLMYLEHFQAIRDSADVESFLSS